jgi:hypothetical protein
VEAMLNGAGRMTSGLCKVLIFLKDFQSAQKFTILKFEKPYLPGFKHYETFRESRRNEGEFFSFLPQLPNPHGF